MLYNGEKICYNSKEKERDFTIMEVLITGATNGIGLAVTEYLSQKGIKVYACDIVEREFSSEYIEFVKLDVTNEESINLTYELLQNRGVHLDAIINVAGIFDIDSFIEVENQTLRKIFEVNLMSVMYVNKTLYPLLKENGRIVITTSEVAPLDPMPFNGIYNTTKTALDCYAQSLRQELNLLGQKVITVRPGAFNTNLSQGSLEKTKELTEKTKLYKAQSSSFYSLVKTFMGKPKDPKKLAPVYYKAITARNPKPIYKKNTNFLLKLLSVLPIRLQCFIIKKILKPKKVSKNKK